MQKKSAQMKDFQATLATGWTGLIFWVLMAGCIFLPWLPAVQSIPGAVEGLFVVSVGYVFIVVPLIVSNRNPDSGSQ
ncbi:hypothetical protein [Arthrobacter sp. B2a2-09]|uniref:hypothetical protein n=1 Tax=Arthrobacter sp. B2a2-09 TaxID=2952822 RepID=UPI0022CDA9CA|nr:hypothetical protein [Arthrobacter sp. B2a2-09]MCZ9884269.1 hypothetical protein [Arthrobacter sp. B2a2-09]